MNFNDPHIQPVVALVAGILVLLMPRLLNYIVALALIVYGLVGLNAIYKFVWRLKPHRVLRAFGLPPRPLPWSLDGAGRNGIVSSWPDRAALAEIKVEIRKVSAREARPDRRASRRRGFRRSKPRQDAGGQIATLGLSLRRRQGRRQGRHAQSARRQGRGPRRDGQSRPAGAARLHHHHRGLHPLLRQRQYLSGRRSKRR